MPVSPPPLMKLLFFDTETNGLPKSRRATSLQVDQWPHIIQLAWTLVEWDTTEDATDGAQMTVCDARSLILNPGDILWNAESAAIHGITPDRVQSEGIPTAQALAQFQHIAREAHVIIAHNIAFDKPVLCAEYYRISPSEEFDWWPSYEYCTMENTKHLCKLPFPSGRAGRPGDPYKLPKLSELHTFLFGGVGEYKFHDALGDVECTVACFQEMVRRRLVTPFDAWVRAFRARVLRDAAPPVPAAAGGAGRPNTRSRSAASSP
jgi:DNA polymerase-3 subunit epsilon